MRLVGYLRVSTDAQVERGLGLEVQEHAIRSWVQERGHELVALTRDEGISGSNSIDTRLGLDDALEMIRTGTAEAVIVYRLDRLARDLIVQETLLREVWAMGGHVFSTSDAESGNLRDDPDDPSRALIRQILGAVAEYERKMIALRLRAGARRKAAAGGYAGGQPPFAWAADGRGALVPVPHEQAILQRMRELRAEGRSFRAIAAQLDREGLPPRRGGRWHGRAVGRILGRLEGVAAAA